jgi:HEAT repeat protein
MDHIEALDFLAQHQPMPADDDLDEDLLARFDAAWRALRDHPDPRAPRLLLNSFGDGSGFGVYQLVEDAIRVQPRDLVIDALCDSLQSPHQGVRAWSAEIALEYPDERLDAIIPSLLGSGDRDARFWAASYLADRGIAVAPELVARARVDADDDLVSMLDELR